MGLHLQPRSLWPGSKRVAPSPLSAQKARREEPGTRPDTVHMCALGKMVLFVCCLMLVLQPQVRPRLRAATLAWHVRPIENAQTIEAIAIQPLSFL
jgi:hypothetical protein